MEKHLVVGLGGRVKVFRTKRAYFKWAFTTKDGWKHLMTLPIFAVSWLIALRYRKEIEEMRKLHNPFEAADGKS